MEANYRHFIENHTLFKGLETEIIDRLCHDSTLLHRCKSESVMHMDEKSTFVFLVVSGWVKIFRETMDGVEAVIDVLGEGKMFGETALANNGHYSCSAEAAEDSYVLAVSLNTIRDLVEKNTVFTRKWLENFAQEIERKNHELEHLSVQSTSERIGCFLLRLTDAKQKGQAEVDLPYDKTLIALKLGMQPETFSRALAKLRESTGIHIRGSKVDIPAVEKLCSYSCHACTSEYPCPDRKR